MTIRFTADMRMSGSRIQLVPGKPYRFPQNIRHSFIVGCGSAEVTPSFRHAIGPAVAPGGCNTI